MDDKLLHSVSDTALWVAYYRTMESERVDAHFHDPYARRLAGERGERIAKSLRQGRAMAWPMIVRTVCFDELISKLVSEGVDTLINLVAGLDSRPYRMGLPASLHWVEVDFPAIIYYKQEHLKEDVSRCRLERVSLNLADVEGRRRLFAQVNASAFKAVVLTEGLLAYLHPEDVSSLAQDLHDQPHFQYWISDLASPATLKRTLKYRGKELASANAPMHFGPAEGPEFFRPQGWKPVEFRDFLDESRRLKREMPGTWMVHLIGRIFPRRLP